MLHRGHVDAAIGHDRRRNDRFRLLRGAERILVEHLDARGGWFEDVELPVLRANIELPVGEHRRSLLERAEAALPEKLAVLEIEGGHDRAVVYGVEPLGIHHW